MVCSEYFYQIGLTNFGNFGSISFKHPVNIHSLIAMATQAGDNAPIAAAELSDVLEVVTELLLQRRVMLMEYFNFDIMEDGLLRGIPLLTRGYDPAMAKLPKFLMCLGPCVDWDDEKECFRTVLGELASFYVPEQILNSVEETSKDDLEGQAATNAAENEVVARRRRLCHDLEHSLFPAFRTRLVVTKELLRAVVEVANLKGLYWVFERC
jgi:DNA mismatch repair protein MLH1